MKILNYLGGTTNESVLFRQVYTSDTWKVSFLYLKSNYDYKIDIQNKKLVPEFCEMVFESKKSPQIKLNYALPSDSSRQGFLINIDPFLVTTEEMQKLRTQLADIEDVIADAEEAFRKYFPGILCD